ncbi:lysylphosphatidylglycerol synthase transmembrane domain-containing protein [Algoriphagus formosus]|uniref:Flippase-like domain-containing protein n=1 Tax=Algoriphagus formosus TaxID=2007308 RepID=A0A4V3AQW2_9BACT|nr:MULTISPECIES: lysylphosphatidylglycerol synthase transmembrane domain-containing protein [Algoriphagus]TDK44267.1 flippase-like domain-containing protein [Algoriphagus aquimaris]
MLHPRIKQILQVLISLGLAVWIFWFLYKDIEVEILWSQVKTSNWFWISFSLIISLFGFWLRGWRWTLLMDMSEGKKVTYGESYHAVMVGYLANLVVPRAGEVARCGVLTRTNGISLGQLLGTVIIERSIDLLFLVGTILLAFLIENQLFISLANQLVNLEQIFQGILDNLPLIIGAFGVLVLFGYLIFRRFRQSGLIQKIQGFLRDIYGGVKGISRLSNPWGFWLSSLLIWIIYFSTMYAVSMGIASTANLSPGEVLLVMVMGSIGMVAPVQGGIGTFHALVAFILIQLGIAEQDGKIFAAIIHGTQLILILIAGLISWVYMLQKPAWKKPESA